ncbi:hypothetical protein [Plesiomonas shigelloides]|uniref:hypothetical protein n=1 Tax=Plesiomonas shigelloides TaxID=703 RepID=UPI00387EEFFC
MNIVKILKEIAPFLSVIVALLAVFIGPFFSAKMIRHQIVVPLRHKWIDDVRELITEFLSIAQLKVTLCENGLINEDNIDEDSYKKLLFIERKLTLLLNPNEKLHAELLNSIRSLLEKSIHGPGNLLTFGPNVYEVTSLAQQILKEEWIRVKSGNT